MIKISNDTDYIFASRKRQVGGMGQRAHWWARRIPQSTRTITPILYMRKEHSWKLKKVLPAIPSHSPGNFFGNLPNSPSAEFIFQGSMATTESPQLSDHINRKKNILMNSPKVLRFYSRGFTKTAKRRNLQKLNILPSSHLHSGRRSQVPGYIRDVETIGFSEQPIQLRPLRRQNALKGRDQNGFLTTNL